MSFRLLVTAGLVLGLSVAASAAPASAASAPKPGSACSISGQTRIATGKAYVCMAGTAGSTWSRGLPRSTSPLTITDSWVKAADSGMTAGFGVISNPTNKAITIVGARSPRFAGVVQLHEVAMQNGAMQMKEKAGGIVVPAGGSVTLAPGGEHLMLMNMRRPVEAGDMVPLTLITSDGGQLRFRAMGKVFAGANEEYDAGMNHGGMS